MKKLRVGVMGATGMVGQRFITLLSDHPWFDVVCVGASKHSAGKTYEEAVKGRWKMESKIPMQVKDLQVYSVLDDKKTIAKRVDFIFCALDLEKAQIQEIEESYAALGIPVVSNNSAHRWTEDVPMIIPEINAHHLKLIDIQRKNRKWEKGLIAVKPNCSIQSYVALLSVWKVFQPQKVYVTSLQAISGAGKTFDSWPEMVDNVIPFIGGEEEKSEKEPLKILGSISDSRITPAKLPKISATCIRVPVSNGHLASVRVTFGRKASKEGLLAAIDKFNTIVSQLALPSSPKQFIHYFQEENYPQNKLHRDEEHGMGISFGRLRERGQHDWQFISLSHNTIRGAAGGAVLLAELLVKNGYITASLS
ncbi:MAG: aspartate-semialdehyde dehydrogenase [Patescibacteria group bacterium]|nr:aspartate-semialdehyde dehydrogenase [Patescibacteria group bacterium]MDE2589007.1 aspartate-semialdehyde dehydrogenase [Patescibacteria group bacterium]